MIEYKLLTGPELNAIDPQGVQWPWDTFAIVAFEGERIVGRLAIRNMPVLEGWFVSEDKRVGEISDELVTRAENFLQSLGATHTACLSYDEAPALRRVIHSYGYKDFPVQLHVKELKKEAA